MTVRSDRFSAAAVYKDPGRYFAACTNCGDCCRIPGIFLPDEIDRLATDLRLDRIQLFRKYLIAELFTPNAGSAPVFVLSPVKAQASGERCESFLSDRAYAHIRHLHCIFREDHACSVYDAKPFGCSLLICGKMTKAKPLLLNKTYYYHQWAGSQEILFSLFPGLENAYQGLLDVLRDLPLSGEKRTAMLARGNAIIRIEFPKIMNGQVAGSRR
jgi:Fe-S-cluster containining protein